jgi:inorganic pyrophosphatase
MPVVPSSALPPLDLQALRPLVQAHLQWKAWALCIEQNGITIERPRTTAHPDYPSVIYPLDYGSVNDTLSTDGEPLDVFVGRGTTGLVGAILTTDHRQHDREIKLLYDCTPAEVYTAHGFINYDRTLLEGVLVLRHPMPALWTEME